LIQTRSPVWYVAEISPFGYLSLQRFQFKIVGDPSVEAWNRVRRYASWMRCVKVDDSSVLTEDTYHKLRLNSPAGGWFPALQTLSWDVMKSNLPHIDLFLSPHLKRISISPPSSQTIPHEILPAIASAISTLPASALETLLMEIDQDMVPPSYLKDSLSSVVLRCGPSLTRFTSLVPLSDAAVNHLIQLPHLRTWHTGGPPPTYAPSSLPPVFPPITKFTLESCAANGWLSLFKHLEHTASTIHGATPMSRVKQSLKSLNIIEGSPDPIIDVSFTSTIQIFRDLVSLNVWTDCHDNNGGGQCIFRLDNDDVIKLVTTLSQLESLLLGDPCFENTCTTTVACLLPISVYSTKLRDLTIHFNTTNVVEDFKGISRDPRFQELRSLPRCTLSCLYVSQTPLTLDGPGFETVANGMTDLFPALQNIVGDERAWWQLDERIGKLQRIRTPPSQLEVLASDTS